MSVGAVPGPFDCWLTQRSIKTLHLRMPRHDSNGRIVAEYLEKSTKINKVFYPGLPNHPQHDLMKASINDEFGFGGMLIIDVGDMRKAYQLMEYMQNNNIGYLAVSLGFYKTLFSAPGASTSSEIPEDEQATMGLSEGMVRMSIGLDNDIERTFQKIKSCMQETGILQEQLNTL